MQSEKKIQYSCRRIKIPAGGEKCVEVMITDKLVMSYYDCKENPAKKVFRDLCDKYMPNQLCCPCKECTLVDEHNTKVIKHYDILDVKRFCNVCERVTYKCSV